MFFSGPLFRWQFRQIRWVTLIALAVALGYTLFEPAPLRFRVPCWGTLFVLVHSALMVCRFGWSRSRSFGFLYTQGYSRDAIWWHMMLASAASVMTVWLPMALIIWSGLRCNLQDAMLNYRFPYSGSLEYAYPLWLLLLYMVFLPTFHYAWIRNLQPTRGPLSGLFIAIVAVIISIKLRTWDFGGMPSATQWLMLLGLAMVSVSMFVGSWRLYRQMEVI